MTIKIEQILLISGTISGLISIILVLFPQYISADIRIFFRGGNIGGVFTGLFTIAGFAGVIAFFINVAIGKRKAFISRLLICLLFIVSISFAGAFY